MVGHQIVEVKKLDLKEVCYVFLVAILSCPSFQGHIYSHSRASYLNQLPLILGALRQFDQW